MHTLPPEIDPVGHAVKDHYQKSENQNIIVLSDIAEDDVIPVSWLFRNYDQMPRIEQHALEHCRGRILDVGAGSGCHSLILQKNGEDVTALEISDMCCKIMAKRGIQKVISGDFFHLGNIKYDTLLFLMNGIGIAGSLSGLTNFLSTAKNMLAPGGQIIFDSSDIDYLYHDEEGNKLINLNSQYYGDLTYTMQYNAIKGEPFKWLFIDFDTLTDTAQKLGLKTELLMKGPHYDYLGRIFM